LSDNRADTGTNTNTDTGTATDTDTRTGTDTSTNTNTNTDTCTGTNTDTGTATNTDTNTDTCTGTNTDTGTATNTDTSTDTTAAPRGNVDAQRNDNGSASGGFYARLKRGLSRTSGQLASGLGNLLLGKKAIDDDLLEELEAQLLMADVGIDATQKIMGELANRVSRKELSDGDAVLAALKGALLDIINPCAEPLVLPAATKPYVILVVGVNGAGKTTTIGKLAHRFKAQGKQVMLAAGDTFRAAAVEQLQTWGERNGVPVIAQHTGADSASVLFDALQAAKARGMDILIADTAGRLQNKQHLMDELSKVVRVMQKLAPDAPHETLLVLDATTGQNAVSQAVQFDQAVGVTGLALTKLDGTARGGVTFAIAQKLAKPIRFIGVGEQVDDLRPFDAEEFVNALFDQAPR
jgi:fused signal recognition particle receptor